MGLTLVMLTVNGNLVCGSVTGECLKRRSSLSYYMFFILKSAVHGEAHARAERLKNKLYGSTLNSNRAYGERIR